MKNSNSVGNLNKNKLIANRNRHKKLNKMQMNRNRRLGKNRDKTIQKYRWEDQ